MEYEEVKKLLRQQVIDNIDLSRDMEDVEIQELIDRCILNEARRYRLSLDEKTRMSREIFYSIRRLDILEELTEDPSVTEIMINGPDNIFIERAGRIIRWEKNFESKDKLDDIIQQIVAACNRTVNESSPIVDARLRGGERVNVVLAPVALNGPIVTIRRFPDKPISMDDLMRFGAISDEVVTFLKSLVEAKYNIIISGGNRIIGLSQMTFRKQRVQTT